MPVPSTPHLWQVAFQCLLSQASDWELDEEFSILIENEILVGFKIWRKMLRILICFVEIAAILFQVAIHWLLLPLGLTITSNYKQLFIFILFLPYD